MKHGESGLCLYGGMKPEEEYRSQILLMYSLPTWEVHLSYTCSIHDTGGKHLERIWEATGNAELLHLFPPGEHAAKTKNTHAENRQVCLLFLPSGRGLRPSPKIR